MEPAHPYLRDYPFACLAHRGGAAEHPESSPRAFAAAVALGYRFIEIDVHASADVVPVVFHDDTLERTTDAAGALADLPLAELRQVRIAGSEPILTLEEALVRFPDTRFNIDIKADAALAPTIDLVKRMAVLDRVCLASFSDRRLREVRRRLGPDVCTSAGPRDVRALKFASWGLPWPPPPADCAQVPVRRHGIAIVTRRFVDHCARRGTPVHVWTIDEEAEMRRLIRLGVHGIVTDRPSLLKRVAIEEGVWVAP